MYILLKRLIDITLSIIGIILFIPIIILICIIIRFTSSGPILYREVRLGLNAHPFVLYRFRTMYSDIDLSNDQAFVQNLINGKYGNVGDDCVLKMQHDPRITKIGKYLRKTSLNDVPQFFNVLKGDMSMVGPRPPFPYEYDSYEEWHKERLCVKPGITGLWQITGTCSTTFDEMVRLDIEYARKKSILFDIYILLKTPFIALFNTSAY